MAISNLVKGGQKFDHPSVGAYFGKRPANDNPSTKVSSDMITPDVVREMMGGVKGIIGEMNRIKTTCVDIYKSFVGIIRDTNKLNDDITRSFKLVNIELNKSRLDFLKSIVRVSGNESAVPGANMSAVPGIPLADPKKQEKKTEDDQKSWLDTALSFLDIADTAKTAWDLAKGGGRFLARAASGPMLLPAAAGAGLIALAAHRKAAQEADPLGAENFDRATASGAKRAEVIQGPEADNNAPNPNADISRKKLSPPDFLMQQGIIKMPSEAKNVIASIKGDIITLKDGRWFDNKVQVLNYPDGPGTPEKAPREQSDFRSKVNRAMQRRAGIVDMSGMVKSDELVRSFAGRMGLDPETDYKAELRGGIPTKINGQPVPRELYTKEQAATVDAAIQMGKLMSGDPEAMKQALANAAPPPPPAAGPGGDNNNAPKPGGEDEGKTPPAAAAGGGGGGDTGASPPPAEAPGGAPSGATAPAAPAAPAAGGDNSNGSPTPAASAGGSLTGGGAGGPTQTETTMVAGQPVEKGKDLTEQQTSAIDMALKMSPENAKNYPKWLIDQYNKSKNASKSTGTSADGTTAAPGGGDAASNAETPAMGSPSQAAAAPTVTPNDDGSVPPKDESKGGAGSPNGAPAAVPAASAPPAPGATPASPEAKPIVMNNESTQNSSSSEGGANSKVAGQNLPMIAHNQQLQQYLAKQNIGYQ
jgi:hypothetical protein